MSGSPMCDEDGRPVGIFIGSDYSRITGKLIGGRATMLDLKLLNRLIEEDRAAIVEERPQ
ncbi:MAG: hypothetical protein CMO80_05465 [Verrucomicrobiales bacterium]|nr:hypothetical protein [Verrucomicrobiales bacterium]|tara:strand:- start:320 stop:499 length:180 start_codon:yes stop_codon:yes gene_type:complete